MSVAPPPAETSRHRFKLPRLHRRKKAAGHGAGNAAGEAEPKEDGSRKVFVTCIDYCPAQVRVMEVSNVEEFVSEHRPPWAQVRWINVDGLSEPRVIQALAAKYELHPLAVDDMLHPGTRPKVEPYPGSEGHSARLFIIARMIYLVNRQLHCEQLCFFLGKNTLLTFQETHGDVWDGVRARIQKDGSRIRENDVSFLLYALMDAVVDQCFPVMECYSDRLEEIEMQVLSRPDPQVINRIHEVKHELLLMRREFWPMREMIHALQRVDHTNFSPTASLFLRDVYDHSVQVIDLMETYREVAIGLTETYMNAMSQRMNEVMKVLTIIATIFMPLSFMAGVFGMNFPHMPELQARWAYPWAYPIGFYTICIGIVAGMFTWFKRKRWL